MLTAILLAAGSSRRMGKENKLLLPYKNKTVVAHVAENIQAAGIDDIVVVLGHEAGKVRSALTHLPVRFVVNPDHLSGMTSSIQTGVQAARGNGYMICLADLVLITPAEYGGLKQAFQTRFADDARCICIPVYAGVRGNPVIFAACYKEAILSNPEKEGCRPVVASAIPHIYEVAMQTSHILQDMDITEEYQQLCVRDDIKKS